MTCLIEFTYGADSREDVFRHLQDEGLADGIKIKGAWVAAQTGVGYVIAEVEKGVDLYNACSRWSDFGELTVIPLVEVSEL
ncbi:MAG: hypothetical protein CMJ78_02210 [Planctomycetaceae bacterium]|nr:hypothetical protein [Planctomycetaceae bacterium]